MISKLLDRMSNYLAHRKGLLPLLGIVLILLNFVLQFILPPGLAGTDILLHLGLIIAIFGFMLARAL
ncbi:MAG: hypothetical protein AB1649_04710 [Chloroflexota bacterium]